MFYSASNLGSRLGKTTIWPDNLQQLHGSGCGSAKRYGDPHLFLQGFPSEDAKTSYKCGYKLHHFVRVLTKRHYTHNSLQLFAFHSPDRLCLQMLTVRLALFIILTGISFEHSSGQVDTRKTLSNNAQQTFRRTRAPQLGCVVEMLAKFNRPFPLI